MLNTLASGTHEGVIEALKTSPWYTHLLVAAALGAASYGLKELDKRRDIDSGFVDITIFVLALAALALVYQGLFGG